MISHVKHIYFILVNKKKKIIMVHRIFSNAKYFYCEYNILDIFLTFKYNLNETY